MASIQKSLEKEMKISAEDKQKIIQMMKQIKEDKDVKNVYLHENCELNLKEAKIPVLLLEVQKESKEKDDDKNGITSQYKIMFKSKDGYIEIASIDENGELIPNEEGLEKTGLGKLVKLDDNEKLDISEIKGKEGKTEEELSKELKEEKEADGKDKENSKEDEKKEELAKKYNVSSSQVIHISNNKKVTQDSRFEGLAKWSKGYDDIYIIPGKDEYTWHTIGSKEGKEEEIEKQKNKQIGGKNPDVTIKRMDGESITEIKPLAMYEIDDKQSYAIVRDEAGKTQMLYCRQEGGDEKTYWGIMVPEANGKNAIQQEPEEREFMSYKNNSSEDLSKKAKELDIANDMEERGAPSKEKGVQTYEINGTSMQNREERKEQIIEDLMKKDGILDRATAVPGFYENKAEKVLKLLESNDKITYKEAVDRVDKLEEREPGGRMPGDDGRKRDE